MGMESADMMTPIRRGSVGRKTASPRGRPAEGADGQASRLSCNHPMDHVQYLGIGDSRLYVRRFERVDISASCARGPHWHSGVGFQAKSKVA